MAGIIKRAIQSHSKSPATAQFGTSYASFQGKTSSDLPFRVTRLLLLSVGSLGVATMVLLAIQGLL